MIRQTLSLVGAMYDAIGPGFLLAVALPFLALVMVVALRALKDRLGS